MISLLQENPSEMRGFFYCFFGRVLYDPIGLIASSICFVSSVSQSSCRSCFETRL